MRAISPRAGVTRLADITGLDRLALPVWQAVRPAGRALSVHQGKGATPLAARIGALCEAIESHCAENVPPDGPLCSIDILTDQTGVLVTDYGRCRARPPSKEPIQWCEAIDLLTGRRAYLPHDVVSLDFTEHGATWFERSSNGLGAGATEAEAMAVSLLELIERDAQGEWERQSGPARRKREINPDSIDIEWFQSWRERFEQLGIELRVFGLPALLRMPVLVCWISGREEFGTSHRSFSGSAAHGIPEIALFKALAESIQSRLTHIAGVRDDILPSHYTRIAAALPLAVPRSERGMARRDWGSMALRKSTAESLAEGLAELGYRRIKVKRLDQAMGGIAVTKAFVPGLGAWQRARRKPQ